ncbi:MAG: TetR/AcrR family transcriptional regulator C-terminal domain-containing protein [Clostridia bacterium]|nr:TetR/AcrR family transcriptional regulator C-terminal domain-containing protein [Clostridia bacterium]
MSNTTKRMLAMSLKSLLTKTTLDNITIQDIVDDAEVSRKTFYYHFQDIYDLMEWTLMEEQKRLLPEAITLENWQQEITKVYAYLQENRALILNAYHSIQRETLENVLMRILAPRIEGLFRLQPDSDLISDEDRRFLVDIYAFGLSGMILRWIGSGMPDDIAPTINHLFRFFSGSLEDVIRRHLHE